MEPRKGKCEEIIKKRQENIKKMSLLNIIDRNVDEKAKEQEIKIKLETLNDCKLK